MSWGFYNASRTGALHRGAGSTVGHLQIVVNFDG
jgi:hypothetical protein